MAKIPTPKPLSPRPRKYIPVLQADVLSKALDMLASLQNVSKPGKVLIGKSLKAAAAGKTEDPETTIAELPPAGQAEVQAGIITLTQDRTNRLSNARAKLMSMSDAEWNALVEEANATE
jgi:hypothetical protein